MTRVDFGQSIDGAGNRKSDIITAYVVTTTLAIVAIFLRFLSRRLAGAKLWIDDWLILAGLTITLGFSSTIFFWTSIGLGKYIGLVTPQSLANSYELIFACEVIYPLAVGIVKLSVIAFYWRILGHTRTLRIVLWAFAAVNVAWMVALIFTIFFQCTPLSSFWDKTIQMSCGVDFKGMLLGNSIPNVLIDVALVCLPLFYIPPRVNTTTLQKVILYVMFTLGFFVTVAPIVRLVIVAKLDPLSRNLTWDFVDYVIWTGAELNTAIVAGCLPSMKPVLAKLVPAAVVPARLRMSGRKDWIASPDQTWLQERVYSNGRTSDAGLQQGTGSRVGLVSEDVELGLEEMLPQRSHPSNWAEPPLTPNKNMRAVTTFHAL